MHAQVPVIFSYNCELDPSETRALGAVDPTLLINNLSMIIFEIIYDKNLVNSQYLNKLYEGFAGVTIFLLSSFIYLIALKIPTLYKKE